MNEMLNQIEMEKRIQQSFLSVKVDIKNLHEQILELKEKNKINKDIAQKNQLKNFITEDKMLKLFDKFEQKINSNINNAAKKIEAITIESKDYKTQISAIKKQQKQLFEESVDITEVEKIFSTKTEIVELFNKLFNKEFEKTIAKQSHQLNDKITILRQEFDEMNVSMDRFKKASNELQIKVNKTEAVMSTNNETIMTALKKRLETLEKNIALQLKQKDGAAFLEKIMEELAMLKQKTMTRDEVDHLFESFSKKINCIREELDDFERNLDTINIQAKEYRI